MRGSTTAIVCTTAWFAAFTTADGALTAFGLEADPANGDRLLVRWTQVDGSVNLDTIKAGDYKIFRGSYRNQVTKIELAAASGSVSAWFGIVGNEV